MRPYDERLEQLLSRAARVFADRGYHSTTMRDLAGATGMSLAGMYYYVWGKEELLHAGAGRRGAGARPPGRRRSPRAAARLHPPPRHVLRRAHGGDEGAVARGQLALG